MLEKEVCGGIKPVSEVLLMGQLSGLLKCLFQVGVVRKRGKWGNALCPGWTDRMLAYDTAHSNYTTELQARPIDDFVVFRMLIAKYQPRLIDPAIAREIEHLVGMAFPEICTCEFDFISYISGFLLEFEGSWIDYY